MSNGDIPTGQQPTDQVQQAKDKAEKQRQPEESGTISDYEFGKAVLGRTPEVQQGDRDKHPYSPERNVEVGHVEEVSPGEKYRVAGVDIGRADLNKPGIKEGMQPVIDILKAEGGQVFITGLESNSRVPGNQFNTGWARADALKQYLIDQGIKESSIKTNSLGPVFAPPGDSSPQEKANWRAATIEIKKDVTSVSGSDQVPPVEKISISDVVSSGSLEHKVGQHV